MKTTRNNPTFQKAPLLMGAVLALGGTFAIPSLAQYTQGMSLTRVKTDTLAASRRTSEFHATTSFVKQQVRARLPLSYARHADAVAETLLVESRRYGFDPLMILAIIQHESRFSPEVRGAAGEVGLMQIKPSTAGWLLERGTIRMPASMPVFDWEKTLTDPAANLRVGISFLSILRDRFPSGGALYLAAYNMGVSRLQQKLTRNERPRIYATKVLSEYLAMYANYRRSFKNSNSLRLLLAQN